jgi:hypothetical protein
MSQYAATKRSNHGAPVGCVPYYLLWTGDDPLLNDQGLERASPVRGFDRVTLTDRSAWISCTVLLKNWPHTPN